ncbi:transposase [Neolewinella xylanilytica]|nr:transposase [Neolewinella xylanilytica]
MNAYVSSGYPIVFSTKYRRPTLTKPNREEPFKCICGILRNKRCVSFPVGGVEDHLPIVCSLDRSIAPASLVKDIKLGATSYIKEARRFPHFSGWQRGYGRQGAHHRRKSSLEEMIDLQTENEVGFAREYVA